MEDIEIQQTLIELSKPPFGEVLITITDLQNGMRPVEGIGLKRWW